MRKHHSAKPPNHNLLGKSLLYDQQPTNLTICYNVWSIDVLISENYARKQEIEKARSKLGIKGLLSCMLLQLNPKVGA